MKCPKCGSEVSPPGKPLLLIECESCGTDVRLNRCDHEPANFSKTGTATYYDPGSAVGITFPYHVCRLCGVFYTDLEAVAAGEKKYEDAK